jgi:hypothetical protein
LLTEDGYIIQKCLSGETDLLIKGVEGISVDSLNFKNIYETCIKRG